MFQLHQSRDFKSKFNSNSNLSKHRFSKSCLQANHALGFLRSVHVREHHLDLSVLIANEQNYSKFQHFQFAQAKICLRISV